MNGAEGASFDPRRIVAELLEGDPVAVRDATLAVARRYEDDRRIERLVEEVLHQGARALRETTGENDEATRRLVACRQVVDIFLDRLKGGHEVLDSDELGELRRQANWMIHLDPGHTQESRETYARLQEEIYRQSVLDIERGLGREAMIEKPHRVVVRLAVEEADFVERGVGRLLGDLPDRVWERLKQLDVANRIRVTPRLVQAAQDLVEDVLYRINGLPPEPSLLRLDIARQHLNRAQETLTDFGERKASHRVQRLQSKIARTIQDTEVLRRQLALVGQRGLRAIEVTNVLLILVVLVIIAILTFQNPSDETTLILSWIDVGICALFLLEFSWRLSLAKGKLLYFARHFLVDVLPSLPFGLLEIHALSSAANATAGSGKSTYGLVVLLRLQRGLRAAAFILRPARPLIRGFRLLVFAIRGMDRLVQRFAPLLNRDIVFFEGARDPTLELETVHERAEAFGRRASRRVRSILSGQDPDRRAPLLEQLLALTAAQLDQTRAEDQPRVSVTRQRGIRVEALLHHLLNVEPEDVEDRLGRPMATRIARAARLFDLPLIRSLPFIRRIVPPLRGNDPVKGVTEAAKGLGRALETTLDVIRYAGDLAGIITGPQLLDRMGSALIKMTQRPSVRLLMFGTVGLLLNVLVELIPGERLAKLQKGIWILVEPLLILGAVCLVLQVIGRWIKKLGGEAGDLFRKVAEAQGINLLKMHKLTTRRPDLISLFDRVIAAEVRCDARPLQVQLERERFLLERPEENFASRALTGFPFRRDRVLLLYQDYLDGAILHRSDTRTTEQFLGNLDLDAIRKLRIGMSKKEEKSLGALDLTRVRPLPTGPYLWFRFITESLAENTAKLVLEYNAVTIPLAHRHLVPKEQLDAMERWLTRSTTKSLKQQNEELLLPSAGVGRFTSLHFLVGGKAMDEQIEREFGDAVCQRLNTDRRAMIRVVFGSFPFESLPRSLRTFNVYDFYFRWLGRGKFLLLVPRLVLVFVRVVFSVARRLLRLVHEQLHPERYPRDPNAHYAPHAVVVRKINRMRKPVFMAALDLRARFDPEYLGVTLPGDPEDPEALATLESDLDLVGAPESDRIGYRERRALVETRLARLESLLKSLGWPELSVTHAVDPGGPTLDDHADLEALRAVTIAYVINYRSCRTLLHGRDEIGGLLRDLLASPPNVTPKRRLIMPRAARLLAAAIALVPDDVPRPLDEDLLRGLITADEQDLKTLLLALDDHPDPEDAREKALKVLAEVARYPMPWSQQLVTLRTVQSLTCLDILNTRRVVESLGCYGTE